MQQKQVGNFFKEKLDPKELTPSCLSQELSRFPGVFFLYLSLNISCNFILIQMVLTPSPMGRRERRKQEELLSSSPSTPDGQGHRGSSPGAAGQAELGE